MSVSILECLYNAEANLDNVKKAGVIFLPIAKEQLHNAVILLEKGYSPHDKVDPLLEKHGDVENVPDKEPS